MRSHAQEGYILVTVLLVLALVGLLGVAALDQSTSALRSAAQTASEERAFYAANAGIEWAMAYLTANNAAPSGPRSETLSMGNYSASYNLTFARDATGYLLVRSEGTSGNSVRVINAKVGSLTPTGYYKAIYSGSTLVIENNGEICGDVYSNEDMTLSNNVHVWKDTPGSPCTNGSKGTAIAAGRLRASTDRFYVDAGKATIDGGWCDSFTVGPACNNQPPVVQAMPAPDFADLYQRALAVNKAYTGPKTLAGNTGDNLVYYVDGDLTINGLTVNGRATYVATGNITFTNDVVHSPTCSDTNPCSAAFITQKQLYLQGNSGRTVWGALISTDKTAGLRADNNATVHGSVVASPIKAGNNAWFYADNPFYLMPPPGLPGAAAYGIGILGWSDGD